MIKKTLGGDRLGSGKKMQVELHGYERSTHDLSYLWRSTMSAGTLVPFMSEIGLPGDTFDINLDADIKTHPTIGPLFGSYKVQLDVFVAPIRLYISQLHNNALGIGMKMNQVKFPVITLNATPIPGDVEDIDNAQINPSSLLAYLGIRGVGVPSSEVTTRDFNAIPLLAYWEIYKNYYSAKAEEVGAVIRTLNDNLVETVSQILIDGDELDQSPSTTNLIVQPGGILSILYGGATPLPQQIYFNTNRGVVQLISIADATGGGSGFMTFSFKSSVTGLIAYNWRYRIASDLSAAAPEVVTFPLSNIDEMREAILAHTNGSTPFELLPTLITPYLWIQQSSNQRNNALNSQEGLGLKTYQSDLFNNWIDTEWIDGTDGISAITSIDTSGGEFTIDTLNLAKKVYDMLNRIAVSGGTYDDWLDVQYGHERYQRAESPMYMGGLSKELVFQEVVSNASADGQDLGTLAGKGVMAKKHKGGKVVVKVEEPSYIIGIVSLTPRVDYSQGNKWDVHLKTMDDLHKPALDEIGFQELIVEQMAWWDTSADATKWNQHSAGKQPAWINYMTNVNVVRGNFAIADNEMFMTLNRRYEYNTGVGVLDLTSYIDPVKFNFIFADSALDAQNFWAQIAVDITARRKMSAKVMPNL